MWSVWIEAGRTFAYTTERSATPYLVNPIATRLTAVVSNHLV
jgi:hypothetical protein